MGNTMRVVKLRADGITCSGCAMDMENILRDKEGILHATVGYSDGIIEIRYDSEVTDRDQVFSAVRGLGFKTRILSES